MRAFQLPVAARSVFALHHPPRGATRGALVLAPAFAEEMNKSRRMMALQSRCLADAGWHVLQVDCCGTGDSEGDFADATWQAWLDDLRAAREWLAAQARCEPWIGGLRLGALLAACSAGQRPAPGLLLWQPVVGGRQHLQQFLRLKAGAEWLSAEREREAQAQPLALLQAGQPVEVAGYTIDPRLALPMSQASLELPVTGTRVCWIEVSPRADAQPSPAALRLLAPLGDAATCKVVCGPSFWQTQEIETAPELLRATVEALAA